MLGVTFGALLPIIGVAVVIIAGVQIVRTEIAYHNGELSNEKRWTSHIISALGGIRGYGLFPSLTGFLNEATPYW